MEELPGQCNYLALGAARIQEIKLIVTKLEKCEHGGRAFQNLPRHMQRRTVSSNPKRLPRCLQERHMREGGANVKPSHRPRRKYRRRPSNLLAEYNRRQKDFVWLETHIWHAKRFHMKRQWGYALPDTPTCKGYRATLRAAKTSCLLQDVSYLCCIELEGPSMSLLDGLSCMMQPDSLALLNTSQVQHGQQWISVMLFEPGRQPYGALGDVDIQWHPKSSEMSETQLDNSKIWIWVHPSAHGHVIEALVQVFQLQKITIQSKDATTQETEMKMDGTKNIECDTTNEDVELKDKEGVCGTVEIMENLSNENAQNELLCTTLDDESVAENKKNVKHQKGRKDENTGSVDMLKLGKRNIPHERTPKYASSDNSITMTLLKDTLNRFRLTGPRSLSVLMAAFTPANIKPEPEDNIHSSCDKSNDSTQLWWKQCYHNEERVRGHHQQVSAWKKLASSHHFSRVVLPITIRDPRVTLPHKKGFFATLTADYVESIEHPDWPVVSPLYDRGLRDIITQSKEPDSLINKRRSQNLVPGSDMPEIPEENRLPILLLSRPPTFRKHGSGWDIVLAAGWGMSVWMPLVFCGGAAGGQQESQNLNMEMLSPMPPHLLPDTPAGSCYTTWLGEQRRIQFFRRPPASRYNFIKLGVQYPFYAPWKKLLQVWEPGTRDIFVLRDTRLLNGLAQQAGNATKAFKKCILKRKADNDLDEIPCKKLQMSLETTGEISSCSRDDASKGPHTEENPRKSHICDTQSKELPSHRCSIEELQKLSHGCLVMVKLILQYKGILEPCAMIYLPEEEDISTRENTMKPTDRKEGITELLHNDTQSEHRLKLKVEHNKIKGRIQHLRRKARSKVAREKDIVAAIQSGESIKKATADALDKIHEQNKEILAKYSSFQEEMENAWLMKINEPLQCCSRKIMGYIINGNFCQTLGRGAGIGWVALKPLLHFINLCKKISGKNVESSNEVQNDDNTVDAWRYAVLVRNPSSLQYHWAKMVIVVESQ
ncbi:ribonucleases P/MRP protein subunit POP1 [Cherax quadricarinatus]